MCVSFFILSNIQFLFSFFFFFNDTATTEIYTPLYTLSLHDALPFSLTGQPNAMGGREVGGLANQLAAHMEIANAEHRALVRRFWNAPNLAPHPGLKAV